MSRRRQLEKRLAELNREKAEIAARLSDIDRKQLVRCENNCYGRGCGKRSRIENLVYIQTYWYEEPYSCTAGDMWHQGEGQFDCLKCGHRNRLYDRPHIQSLKHLFKKVVTSHSTKRPPKVDEECRG